MSIKERIKDFFYRQTFRSFGEYIFSATVICDILGLPVLFALPFVFGVDKENNPGFFIGIVFCIALFALSVWLGGRIYFRDKTKKEMAYNAMALSAGYLSLLLIGSEFHKGSGLLAVFAIHAILLLLFFITKKDFFYSPVTVFVVTVAGLIILLMINYNNLVLETEEISVIGYFFLLWGNFMGMLAVEYPKYYWALLIIQSLLPFCFVPFGKDNAAVEPGIRPSERDDISSL